MNSKNLLVLVVMVLGVTTTVFGKKYKGYIVNKNGIKIEGLINARNVISDQVKITFYQGRKKKTYKPKDIQGYGYEHIGENQFGEDVYQWRHYKSKIAQSFAPRAFASKQVFMEIMEEGEVTVYDYYVQAPSDIKNPYKRFFYLEKQGSKEFIEISKDNYIETAKDYFGDYNELASNIGKINHRFRHLYKVVKLYNTWLSDNTVTADRNEAFPF